MKSLNPTGQSTATSTDVPLSSQPTLNPETSGASGTASSVKRMADDAKRKAGDVLGQAKERAAAMASEQKQSAAQHINRYSSALRDSAKNVENEDPNIAYYANRAADGIERVADYVRNTDFEGLRRDTEDIARRHPALFMGGLFVAGLVLGGIVKASAQSLREQSQGGGSFDDPSLEFPRDEEPLASTATATSGEGLSQTSSSL